jgi:hypothetical protein
MPASVAFTLSCRGTLRQVTALREDHPWGHGIHMTLAATESHPAQDILFACHPERSGFAACQALTTEGLIERACAMLASGDLDDVLARHGVEVGCLLVVLDMPRATSA